MLLFIFKCVFSLFTFYTHADTQTHTLPRALSHDRVLRARESVVAFSSQSRARYALFQLKVRLCTQYLWHTYARHAMLEWGATKQDIQDEKGHTAQLAVFFEAPEKRRAADVQRTFVSSAPIASKRTVNTHGRGEQLGKEILACQRFCCSMVFRMFCET